MTDRFEIAGYCRISVDDELDKDNTSIENQKSIIEDYVKRTFPGSHLTFYEDRDRSGYTFEQRENYMKMRELLMAHQYDILIVKDLSRFSRRNGRGLVELEDLRDAGVRIIAIGDSIDYPTNDDWMRIQIYFFVNEMPVTDTSKKVKNVIKRRQEEGKWICSVPYGYVITNTKTMAFEVEPNEAEVVKEIFRLYIDGWGYKRIANYLTGQHIPTPRSNQRDRIEARGEECKYKVKPAWSIVTVQGILQNDFYIGTLRQGKYTRKKINGDDMKKDESEHIVFENHHEGIVDFRTFTIAQEALKKRTTSCYRGVKKYDNVYSGFMVCGDCGSPMFPMSRSDLKEAYRCGTYHKMGLSGCTSHHIRADILDEVLKGYLREVKKTSTKMIKKLNKSIETEKDQLKKNDDSEKDLEKKLVDIRTERATLSRQMAREIMRDDTKENLIIENYQPLLDDCDARIEGIQNQILLNRDKRNTVIRVNRIAKEAISIIDEILNKEKLDKNDLEFIIDKIYVYEDHIHVKLKDDIECILKSGTLADKPAEEAVNFNSDVISILNTEKIVQSAKNHRPDKVYDVSVISNGDPLEIYTGSGGEVVFKKYSPMGELSGFASEYADALAGSTNLSVIICDRDHCIAATGVSKKDVIDRPISADLEKICENRRTKICESNEVLYALEGTKYEICVAVPIISAGDITGSVVFLRNERAVRPFESDIKLAGVAAKFLGNQTE